MQRIFRKGGLRFGRCGACRHVCQEPGPAPLDTASEEPPPAISQATQAWFRLLAQRRADLVEEIAGDGPCRRILDVGCGPGFFLREAEQRGWFATGVDKGCYDAFLSNHVLKGDALAALKEIPAGSFGIITFWHSLEHFAEPGRILAETRRVLTPGGILVINSPNIDSMIFRVLGRHWTWVSREHLQYFSVHRFAAFLESSRWRILRKETWTEAPNLLFAVEDGFLWAIARRLNRCSSRRVRRWAASMRDRLSAEHHQTATQMSLKKLYDHLPALDRFLQKHDLGHEFLLVATSDGKDRND